MWPTRLHQRDQIRDALADARAVQGLLGIPTQPAVDALSLQFVASLRREAYYRLVQAKQIAPTRADPNCPSFDAERAVAYHLQQGDIDEAGWLLFLMTHFARHGQTGWRRLQDVYGHLGQGRWGWRTVTGNPDAFYRWLSAHWQQLGGGFGNHRKYESLRPTARRPFAAVVAAYLAWIGPAGHAACFAQAVRSIGNDPHVIFDGLYQSLTIISFGRLAKFDYLMLVARYGLAPISPGSAYLDGATGPTRGARLLVDGRVDGPSSTRALQAALDVLDRRLQVGMEVMEDALCNWQKSPNRFVHYKG